ncbi:hypothetical protein M9Y10_021267 [Tritrichomonas musculus]|uniref:Uncharacterized protein n=1 Tax=Tritrichomonas musculus TaxID=1915356 RepID=A0ABR2HDK3_9EUKA
MDLSSFLFFSLFVLSFSTRLRDIAIGEWDVFPVDSDFTQSSFTIEFHQSSTDPLEQTSLNCTLWKDESMHSHLPSAFVFNIQGPLLASLQIKFNSDYSGSIYNIRTDNFNQNSILDLQTSFSFNSNTDDGNKKISKFKIGKYSFVIDISELVKDGQITVDVSSSLDDKDSSLIASKNKYIVIRTREYENKKPIRIKQTSKSYSDDNLERISKEQMESKFVSKIKDVLKSLEIDIPNDYILPIFGVLIIFAIFLFTKIITVCLISPKQNVKPKTTTVKKVRKHKKKNSNLDNPKEEKDETKSQKEKQKEETNENGVENDKKEEIKEKLKQD